ncbi:hemin-degrading factor [Pseudoroseomonas cervicalis]|uniref:hemin-degrading factor n=1 Tax=Teichococcus cervicalis TaxID=204525 RepID=UPI002786BCAF|nr:ChuX/HutX family heme-like substrate-binding protein [Pseudoroseomonas cervicalis]MDQ1077724.1 putative hemin transport protein [Pseudoroseomonas cervicalis]
MHSLLERFQALRAETPHLRARDAAARLGTTEAALLASGALGPVTPLRPDWAALIGGMPALGRIMALTRNEMAVHERYGQFRDVSSGPGHILVLGPEIDLRLFPGSWTHGFALGGERPSIQIFDDRGVAVHKIYAAEGTDRIAWASLVDRFADPAAAMPPLQPAAPVAAKAEAEVDGDSLRSDWLALRDTHDFFPLLRRHKASRRQAFRLAGEDLARRLAPAAAAEALRLAAERAVPVMVFVGNRGAIQIHTGPVQRLLERGGWFNVLDADFNLHLRQDGVAEAWLVTKPTEDGAVTSIELLDAAGEVIAMLFGARKPGQAELPEWRALATEAAARQPHAAQEVAA